MKPGKKAPCSDGSAHRPEKPAAPASRPDPARQKAELEVLIQKIHERVSRDPDKAATILTDWLKQPARKNAAIRKKAG